MRHRLLPLAIASTLPLIAHAQANPEAHAAVPVNYVGANTNVALGVDDDLNILGELRRVFGYDGDSAWLAGAWLGHGGAAGLQLDYHWLWNGKTRQDTVAIPSGVIVAKAFVAVDQNPFDDRKASLGVGFERENISFDAYVSKAITGERLISTSFVAELSTLTGVDNGRPFEQTQIVNTRTDWFAKPYDWGLGTRLGRFFENTQARLRGGFDYEKGDFGSKQLTFSVGLDKYFRNSPHSLSFDFEHYERDGDFDGDRSDQRAWLLWRYDIGQNFRSAEEFREVEVTASAKPAAEPVVIKNEVRMEAESFFALDKAGLDAEAQAALADVIAAIRAEKRVSRVQITGHTCDLGPEDHNQKLSERRAAAVRDFFASQGIPATELDISGEGEVNPKYPNDGEANRAKNRRVDITFLTIEESTQQPTVAEEAPVQWTKEKVPMPAAWIERALRNPAQHKRTVDVYQYAEITETTELGPRVFGNRGPVAVNDALAIMQDTQDHAVNVLANDSDPDGDPLTITTIGAAAHGSARLSGTQVIYTPNPGYNGTDAFTYAISDGRGGTAQATVTVTVSPSTGGGSGNRPPIARDDVTSMLAYNVYAYIFVMANDSDPDGDATTVVSATAPGRGTVRINAGQTITYFPTPGLCGIDAFTYTISDGRGGTATARVTIDVIDCG